MSRIGICLTMNSGLPLRTLTQYAQRAEERGFTAIFTNGGVMDSLAYLHAFGHVTKRVQLGTGIANIYVRHPVQMAASARVVDDITDGRVILGLGIGHAESNVDSLGLNMGKPLQVLREYVTIVRKSLTGEPVSFEGTYYHIKNHRLSAAAGRTRIPVHIAVLGLRSAELAGEATDGAILNLASVQHTTRAVAQVVAGTQRAGRRSEDVEIVGFLRYIATQDPEAANHEAKAVLARYGGSHPFYNNMYQQSGFEAEAAAMRQAWERGDAAAAVRSVSDAMVDAICLYGDRQRCWDGVERFLDAGVQLPVIYPDPVDGKWEAAFEMAINTFAQE